MPARPVATPYGQLIVPTSVRRRVNILPSISAGSAGGLSLLDVGITASPRFHCIFLWLLLPEFDSVFSQYQPRDLFCDELGDVKRLMIVDVGFTAGGGGGLKHHWRRTTAAGDVVKSCASHISRRLPELSVVR